jgi:hypothetical protein
LSCWKLGQVDWFQTEFKIQKGFTVHQRSSKMILNRNNSDRETISETCCIPPWCAKFIIMATRDFVGIWLWFRRTTANLIEYYSPGFTILIILLVFQIWFAAWINFAINNLNTLHWFLLFIEYLVTVYIFRKLN